MCTRSLHVCQAGLRGCADAACRTFIIQASNTEPTNITTPAGFAYGILVRRLDSCCGNGPGVQAAAELLCAARPVQGAA